MKRLAPVVAALVVGAAVALGGLALAAPDEPSPVTLGPEPVTVVVDVEHSRFIPSTLRVEVGTEVRFVVRNDDPINHELIVGAARCPCPPPQRHRSQARAEARRAVRRSR